MQTEAARQDEAADGAAAREVALREILDAISRFRDDEGPVFETILRSAARLCDAPSARLDIANASRTRFRVAASFGASPRATSVGDEYDLDTPHIVPATIREGRSFHVPDLADTDLHRAGDRHRTRIVDGDGWRTCLTMPLLHGGVGVGCIVLGRREVKPFTDADIALLETFAAQAVIAIENTRQFRELQSRLARESATREILQVISRTRENEAPVFDVILENACRLCRAPIAMLSLTDERGLDVVIPAHRGVRPEFRAVLDAFREPLGRTELVAVRPLVDGSVVRVDDLSTVEPHMRADPRRVQMVEMEGVRSVISVPMTLDGAPIGAITLWRREVDPFSDDDAALVETFAAQAAIAVENTRRFRELGTRLEREAASREILDVVSRSRDDEAPVFAAILNRALRLCAADTGGLQLLTEDGDALRLAAVAGADGGSFTPGGALFALDLDIGPCRAAREGRVIHMESVTDDPACRAGDPDTVRLADGDGVKTQLCVPLMRDGAALGNLSLSRLERRPFAADEIALIETFAAQAVIAIDNARQFRELQSRLEREAATREVLQVISAARDDEGPVFEAILANAARLCGAEACSLMLLDAEGTHNEVRREHGVPLLGDVPARRWALDSGQAHTEAVRLRRPVHVPDLSDTELYRQGDPTRVALVDEVGLRSVIAVPLMSGEAAIGAILVHRLWRTRPFTEREVTLIETFAAQAVIAIDNARQFRELQERLERERATREVLQVISAARDDERPVFDAVLDRAQALCDAPVAALILADRDTGMQRLAAQRGVDPATIERYESGSMPLDGGVSYAARCIVEGRRIEFADMGASDLYAAGSPVVRAMVDVSGIRAVLFAPLMRDGEAIGCITLFRGHGVVAAFDERQVALVETFAAQAVIAIDKVRQFRALRDTTEEVRALNAGLEARVAEQVGEIERLGRLRSFLPAPVAAAVLAEGEGMLASHRALVAVLFCDMRGFTAFCETAEPEETIEILQTYHEEMGRLLQEHGAGVDHRAGDGLMVIFNDPLPCDDPAGDAVRLALAMRARMEELCRDWKRMGHRLGFGVGVSLGWATVGVVGAAGRFEYTANGTTVNLAARLCDQAADGEILLAPRAVTAVEDDFETEPRGELELKGIKAPVPVHRVLGPRATA